MFTICSFIIDTMIFISQATSSEDGLELIKYLSMDCTDTEGGWHSASEVELDKLGYVIHNRIK